MGDIELINRPNCICVIYISRFANDLFVFVQPSVANATNIDTLLANKEGIECVKVPPENLQDKVFFIFNNLSMSNMDSKVSTKPLILL